MNMRAEKEHPERWLSADLKVTPSEANWSPEAGELILKGLFKQSQDSGRETGEIILSQATDFSDKHFQTKTMWPQEKKNQLLNYLTFCFICSRGPPWIIQSLLPLQKCFHCFQLLWLFWNNALKVLFSLDSKDSACLCYLLKLSYL